MHVNIKITGRVQGVFFRDSAQKKAKELKVRGFVRNEPDGSVYIEAEGEPLAVKNMVEWVKNGPQNAEVEHVEVEETKENKNFIDFKIEPYHGGNPYSY